MPIQNRANTLGRTVSPASYSVKKTGEIVSGGSAVQLPSVAAYLFQLRAKASNNGSIYVGFAGSVALPDSISDQTTGFELQPGETTGWLPLSGNLNEVWMIPAVAGEGGTWMSQG